MTDFGSKQYLAEHTQYIRNQLIHRINKLSELDVIAHCGANWEFLLTGGTASFKVVVLDNGTFACREFDALDNTPLSDWYLLDKSCLLGTFDVLIEKYTENLHHV